MSLKFIVALLLSMTLVVTAKGQEFQSQAATAGEPKEAFAESAPLLNVKIDESFFNAREQRLREHYLEVPILPLAGGRDIAEGAAAVVPETPAPKPIGAEAGSVIVQNHELTDAETTDATSGVCEPSLAVRGSEILVTGNWFACFSKDGGASFQYRNPYTMFPTIANRPFCCDQVALYVPSHDLMVWFLQHGKDGTGNTVRLAVAHGADIAAEHWRYYDFTPQSVGNWSNEWFDYPDISHSNNYLFVTTNCFSTADQFRRSVALRIPLAELKSYAAINYRFFDKTDVGSLKLAASSGDTMYIGTHKNLGELRVFKWPDGGDNYFAKDFSVQPWVRGSASAPGPDGRDWLGFVDGRITAGWTSGNTQGFAWTSAQGGTFTRPHVRIADLNWEAGTVNAQPHIWSSAIAFAYPSATTNGNDPVAVSLSFGGGSLYPSHAVGFFNTSATSWDLATTTNGNYGPDRNRWGDYLTVRVNGSDSSRFATIGFTQSGGPTRTDIVPRLIQFRYSPTESTVVAQSVLESMQVDGTTEKTELIAKQILASIGDETNIRGKFDKQRPEKIKATSSNPIVLESPLASTDVSQTVKAVVQFDPETISDKDRAFMDLPPVSSFAYDRPESLCLPDDRQQAIDTVVPPFNTNCQLIITLNDGSQAVGTGWFYGPRCIVTAGHCVHEGDGGNFFRSVEVIPAMNGLRRPFGSKVSVRLRATTDWQTSGIQALDYGAILLDDEFVVIDGKSVAPLEAQVLSDTEFSTRELAISGYPADKPNGTQWFGFGPVANLQPDRVRYMIDTFGGHSGSAVTITDGDKRFVIGIHNYGGCPNKCTRITAAVKANLDQWLAESLRDDRDRN